MDADQSAPVCIFCGKPLFPSDESWMLISRAEAGAGGEPELETQEIVAMAHTECWEGGEWRADSQ